MEHRSPKAANNMVFGQADFRRRTAVSSSGT
jgi:hypothetical protein